MRRRSAPNYVYPWKGLCPQHIRRDCGTELSIAILCSQQIKVRDRTHQQTRKNMVTKKPKGLGRGLDALLGGSGNFNEAIPNVPGAPSMLRVTELQAGKYQPRTRMDEGALNELAASIKAQGVLQAILVRPVASHNGAGKYEIIAGE